ncbi:hypothetical protein H257_19139 [Aphanomyces astaci]|uniref:Crinkler effector protein N-terminal domain-containing protein n=1 Tax=Aphanomyces astaci TaxID=112090 RepID=W4FAH2_APHAT|nr:hypothetical protein H257_19139 [Aphanomyces astaci]ETV63924.1 hypothetical protein H257_19139 [Aphanomyces astaci]|eukprot:XP_009846589.1 hypothetical protein H257_19139 [Aphanomyces astaci]
MAYLHTLLTLLTRGRVGLLQEELGLLLYHIADVDMPSFFHECLPQFVGDGGADSLQCWTGQVDEPTFVKELGHFLIDFRVGHARQFQNDSFTHFSKCRHCTGPPFSVTIHEDNTIDNLKEKIAIKTMYQFPAYSLELVMAKDGAGFSCEAAPAVTLDELQDVQRFKAMRPALSMKKAFGGTFPSNEEEVYVFAVAPKWRLFCVVVGGIGPPFPVTIREDETVGELKEKIAIKTMYQFPAYSLELVMAKDGAGFSCEAAPAVTLDELQDVQRFKAMRPALSMKKAFGGTFPSNEEEVYVFAVAPKWRLFCVVVGGIGPPFPVTIREDETVGELKEKIAIKTMYQFPAYSLELVMAKDGAGFYCEAAPAVTLGELQDVQRFKAMGPALSIKKAFGGTIPSNEGEVYVFAVAPDQPAASTAASLVEYKKHKRNEDESSMSISRLSLPKIAQLGYSTKGWTLPPVDGVPR